MVEKVTKKVNIEFTRQGTGLAPRDFEPIKDEVRRAVGDTIVEEIQRSLDKSKSPVEGGSFKRKLSKEYAKKVGRKESILLKEGDMRSAITYEETPNGIEIGIFDSNEAPKADGHNRGSNNLPKRQFIPHANQRFDEAIMKKAKDAALRVIKRRKEEIAKLIKEDALKG